MTLTSAGSDAAVHLDLDHVGAHGLDGLLQVDVVLVDADLASLKDGGGDVLVGHRTEQPVLVPTGAVMVTTVLDSSLPGLVGPLEPRAEPPPPGLPWPAWRRRRASAWLSRPACAAEGSCGRNPRPRWPRRPSCPACQRPAIGLSPCPLLVKVGSNGCCTAAERPRGPA